MEKERLESIGKRALIGSAIAPMIGAPCALLAWYLTRDFLATAIVVVTFLALTACLGFFGYAALESPEAERRADDDSAP